MAAKRFQTLNEEEIEQLLRDKSSKSTNEVFNEVLTFVILTFMTCDLLYMQTTGICNILQYNNNKILYLEGSVCPFFLARG